MLDCLAEMRWATGTSTELKVVDTALSPNMVMKQRKKKPVRYRLPKEGLFAPPSKMKRISRNSYPVVEEGVLSGFPK
jgi:hypothetical protein